MAVSPAVGRRIQHVISAELTASRLMYQARPANKYPNTAVLAPTSTAR